MLGFFDALKSVREANRQDVPSHLRDANRDGDAFGDGVGYRYPHAYAEHWVEQQYLPTALQGEVFWQPGQLGWEGERRERMAERRAAQLAAAAELATEQPLLLSSGPDSPAMERWIQRQLGQEGERLHLLRQRLWAGVSWQRQDRVLLLGCHSLLWALDPLRQVPEGGVTLICPSPDDRQRLAAQIDLLEPERQPQLLDGLEALPSDQVFDWIGGRLGTADLPEMNWTELAQFLTGHADRNANESSPFHSSWFVLNSDITLAQRLLPGSGQARACPLRELRAVGVKFVKRLNPKQRKALAKKRKG